VGCELVWTAGRFGGARATGLGYVGEVTRKHDAHDDFDGSQVIETATMVLFWHPPAVFGQWTASPFVVGADARAGGTAGSVTATVHVYGMPGSPVAWARYAAPCGEAG